MKRHTLFILLLLQVFVFPFAFADQTLNSNLQLDAIRVKSIVNQLQEKTELNKTSLQLEMDSLRIEKVFNELQNQLETNTSDSRSEIFRHNFEAKNQYTPIIFVTGSRGNYHSADSNVPLTITHFVVQPNGEVFQES